MASLAARFGGPGVDDEYVPVLSPPRDVLGPVRVVVCAEDGQAIRVSDMEPADSGFVGSVVETIDAASREQGGTIPVSAMREVIANLLHAHFAGASVIVMPGGSQVVVADRGPGIEDPVRALLPGFSTATQAQRRYMRGTGMGLPLAKAAMEAVGGHISVERNLAHGTVVSLHTAARGEIGLLPGGKGLPRLSDRDKRVLSLLGELGSAGPTTIANDLGIPLSTAHRLLTRLEEEEALVVCDARGKRRLSKRGVHQVGLIFSE